MLLPSFPPIVHATIPAPIVAAVAHQILRSGGTTEEIVPALTFAASEGLTTLDDVIDGTIAWRRYGAFAHAAADAHGGWTTVPGSLADRVARATAALTARAAALTAAGVPQLGNPLRVIAQEIAIDGMGRASQGLEPFVLEDLVTHGYPFPFFDEEPVWAARADEAATTECVLFGDAASIEVVDEATARAVAATAHPPGPDDFPDIWVVPGNRYPMAVRSILDIERDAPLTGPGLPVVLHALRLKRSRP